MTVENQLNGIDGEAFNRDPSPQTYLRVQLERPPVWQSYAVSGKDIIALDTRGRLFILNDGAWFALPPPPEK